MQKVEPFDISTRAHKAHSHSLYTTLRESTPIFKVMLPTKEPAWLLSRYADVSSLLKDPRFAKDRAHAMTADQLKRAKEPPKLFRPLRQNMLGMDDPDHCRLKRLVQAGFTPKRVELLTGRTEEIAERLLDRFGRKEDFRPRVRFCASASGNGHLRAAGSS